MNRAPVQRFVPPPRPSTVNDPPRRLTKGTIDQFIASVSSGDLEEVREFVMDNKNNWNVVDPSGNSPVHTLLQLDKRIADNEKKLSILKFMTEKGVSLESPGPGDVWPIHLAVATGSDKIVRFMIDQGVRTDRVDASGNTIMHYAIYGKKVDCPVLSKPQPLMPAPVVEKIPFNKLLGKTNDLVLDDIAKDPETLRALQNIANTLDSVTEMQQVRQLLEGLQATIADIFLESAMNPNYSSSLSNHQATIQSQIDEIYASVNNDIVKGAVTPIDLEPGNGGWGYNATDDRSKITRKTIDQLKKEAENYRQSIVKSIEKESSGIDDKEGATGQAVSFIKSFQDNARRLQDLFKNYLSKLLFCPECRGDEYYGSRTTLYRFFFLYLYHDYHVNYGGYLAEKLIDSDKKIIDKSKFRMVNKALQTSLVPQSSELSKLGLIPLTYGSIDRTLRASALSAAIMEQLNEGEWRMIAPLLAVQVYQLENNYPYYAFSMDGIPAPRPTQIAWVLIPRASAALIGFRAWLSEVRMTGTGDGRSLKGIIKTAVKQAGYQIADDRRLARQIHGAAKAIYDAANGPQVIETDGSLSNVLNTVFAALVVNPVDQTNVINLVVKANSIKPVTDFAGYLEYAVQRAVRAQKDYDPASPNDKIGAYLTDLLAFGGRFGGDRGIPKKYRTSASKMAQISRVILDKASLTTPDSLIDLEAVISMSHAYAPAIGVDQNPNMGYVNYLGTMAPVAVAFNLLESGGKVNDLAVDPRKLMSEEDKVAWKELGTAGKNYQSLVGMIDQLRVETQRLKNQKAAGTDIGDLMTAVNASLVVPSTTLDGAAGTASTVAVQSGQPIDATDRVKVDGFVKNVRDLTTTVQKIVGELEGIKGDFTKRALDDPNIPFILQAIDQTLTSAKTALNKTSQATNQAVRLGIVHRDNGAAVAARRAVGATPAAAVAGTAAEALVATALKPVLISLHEANLTDLVPRLDNILELAGVLGQIDTAVLNQLTVGDLRVGGVTPNRAAIDETPAAYRKITGLEWDFTDLTYEGWTSNAAYDGTTLLSSTTSRFIEALDDNVAGTISGTVVEFLRLGAPPPPPANPPPRPPAEVAVREKLLQLFSLSGDNQRYLVSTERTINPNVLERPEFSVKKIGSLLADLQVPSDGLIIPENDTFLDKLNDLMADLIPLISDHQNQEGPDAIFRSEEIGDRPDIYAVSFLSRYPYVPRTPFQCSQRETGNARVQILESYTLLEMFMLFNAIYQLLVQGSYQISRPPRILIGKGLNEWEEFLNGLVSKPVRIPKSRYQVSIGTIGETYPWFIALYRVLIRQTLQIIRETVGRPINQILNDIRDTPKSVNTRYDPAANQALQNGVKVFLAQAVTDEAFFRVILPAKYPPPPGGPPPPPPPGGPLPPPDLWTRTELKEMDLLRDRMLHNPETRKKLMELIPLLIPPQILPAYNAGNWYAFRGRADKAACDKQAELQDLIVYRTRQVGGAPPPPRTPQAPPTMLSLSTAFQKFTQQKQVAFMEMVGKLDPVSLRDLYSTGLDANHEAIDKRLVATPPTITLEAAMTDVFGYQILLFFNQAARQIDNSALINKIIQDVALLMEKKVPYLIAQFLLPKLITVIVGQLLDLHAQETAARNRTTPIRFLLARIKPDSGEVAGVQLPKLWSEFSVNSSADSGKTYQGLQSLIAYHDEITRAVNLMSAFNLEAAVPAGNDLPLARVFSKELPTLRNLPEKLDDFLTDPNNHLEELLRDYRIDDDLVYYSDNSSVAPGSNAEARDTPLEIVFPGHQPAALAPPWELPDYWNSAPEIRPPPNNFGGQYRLFNEKVEVPPGAFGQPAGTPEILPAYSQPHNIIYRSGLNDYLLIIVPGSISGEIVQPNGDFGSGFIAYRERGSRNVAEGTPPVSAERLESHLIIVKQEIVQKAIELFATKHPSEYAELSELGSGVDYREDPVRAQIIVGRLADGVVNKAIEYSLREAIAGAILRMAQAKNPPTKLAPLKRIIDLVHADVVTKFNMVSYETNELDQVLKAKPDDVDVMLPQIEPAAPPASDLIHHIYNINYYSGNATSGKTCYLVNPKIIDRLASVSRLAETGNSNGELPLHLAINNLNPQAVKILIKHGANPRRFTDSAGRSAIDLALAQLQTHLDYCQGSIISERLSGFVQAFNTMMLQSLQSGAAKNNIVQGAQFAIPIMLCVYQHMHLSYLNNYRYGISHQLRGSLAEILAIPNVPSDLFDLAGTSLISVLKNWYPSGRIATASQKSNAGMVKAAEAGVKIYQNQIESYQKDLETADPVTKAAIEKAIIEIEVKKTKLEAKISGLSGKSADLGRVESNASLYPIFFKSIESLPRTLDEIDFYRQAFTKIARESSVHLGFWEAYQDRGVDSSPSMIILGVEDTLRSLIPKLRSGNTKEILERLSVMEEYLDKIRRYSNIKSRNPNLADNPALEHEYQQITYIIGLILTPAIKNIFLKQVVDGILSIKRDLGGTTVVNILGEVEKLKSGGETIESYLTNVLPLRACKFYNLIYSGPEDPDRKITRSEDLYEPLIQIVLTTTLTQLTDQTQMIKDLRSYLIPFFSETYQKVIHHLRLVIYSYEKYLLNTWQLVKVLRMLFQGEN